MVNDVINSTVDIVNENENDMAFASGALFIGWSFMSIILLEYYYLFPEYFSCGGRKHVGGSRSISHMHSTCSYPCTKFQIQ